MRTVKIASAAALCVILAGCIPLPVHHRYSGAKTGGASSKTAGDVLMIADFDSGKGPNNLGGNYGTWDKDPNDDTQGYKSEFYSPGYDSAGKCLKLAYDVDSPNSAYGGFWMKLEGLDARSYRKFSFWVKGDAKESFTTRVKIELKNDTETSAYYLSNISDVWDVVEIPLSSFNRISDWSKMKEFVVVFEDAKVTQKTGTIYIDDISFVK